MALTLDLDKIGTEDTQESEKVVKNLDGVEEHKPKVESKGVGEVIRRMLHLRVPITIYPNGSIYPSQPQCWFESKKYGVNKKKKKPKKVKVMDTLVGQTEEY